MESDECMLKYFVEDDEYDDSIEYGDGYCDYADGYFYDEENGWDGMEMSPVSNSDAIILGTDEKRKSESSMDTKLISHPLSLSDEEKTNMDIKDRVSVENMATERQKKEKRKSQENGVESEQNARNEIAIEVKKKKDSISKSDV
ncbi:hypothetical protein MKW94_002514 [Papaver nudicaule]|uniref:Uncharacterized protein n=1 Tax=Papaver nudicaule TaxID=74823 RepID=A0AA41SP34_PAPNU|nr:hypothetical protein [Papaver nudicaule]